MAMKRLLNCFCALRNVNLGVFYRKGRYLNSDRLFAMYPIIFKNAKRYVYWKMSV